MNKSSEQLGELFAALAKAQGQIRAAGKDGSNPYFKSSYATLDSCWEAARSALSANGLSVVQTLESSASGAYSICTILGHASGQFICSTLPLLMAKQDVQSFGSAISYMRRYAFCALVGITQSDEMDDDGEKAVGRGVQASQPQSTKSAQTSPKEEKRYITPQQAEEISILIGDDFELGQRILSLYKVLELEDIESNQYDSIIKRLQLNSKSRKVS